MAFDLCHFLLNILIFWCIWIAFDKILVGNNFSFIYRGVMNLDSHANFKSVCPCIPETPQ